MPRFAYVVLSYRDPVLVSRLVAALRAASPTADIVVRHDIRREPLPDLPTDPRVHARPSDKQLHWGHWSIVEAMLAELRWVRTTLDVTHVAFISGQDYPTGSLAGWEDRHDGSDGRVVAQRLHFRPRWLAPRGFEGRDDLIRYSYAWFGVPGSATRPPSPRAGRLATKVFDQIRPLAYFRVLPHGRGTLLGIRRVRTPWSATYPCYKGWPWMSLSTRAADTALAAASSDHDLVRLYRRSLIPEESFFQTVLMNASGLRLTNAEITYTDWAGSVEHPQALDSGHLGEVLASGLPFARKVSLGTSDELLQELDRRIAGEF